MDYERRRHSIGRDLGSRDHRDPHMAATAMKVLTVRQPWASAFFVAPSIAKDVENRVWPPPDTIGRIAIHAALTVDEDALLTVGTPRLLDRSVGVILGTVEVTSYHRAGDPDCRMCFCDANPWAMFDADGRMWHWMIEHARRFVTPIKARGNLGLWEPGPSVAHLIEIAEVVA